MTDSGPMVIADYNQEIRYAQDFHVEFDYFITEDPGEAFYPFELSGVGSVKLQCSDTSMILTASYDGQTPINESFTISGGYGNFNKVQLTFQYTGTDASDNALYNISFKHNNDVVSRSASVPMNITTFLFSNPMSIKFNGFTGTQFKNIVFNEVSCTNLGATAVQWLRFDSDDTISLIYDHTTNENDVTTANNSELILKG